MCTQVPTSGNDEKMKKKLKKERSEEESKEERIKLYPTITAVRKH